MKLESPSLSKHKSKEQKIVYKTTKNTTMKFRVEKTPGQIQSPGIIHKIRSLSRYFSKQNKKSNIENRSSEKQISPSDRLQNQSLKYLFRLDNETYLIGNSLQLDAINISIVEDYVQTDHLWTLNLGSPLLNVFVDNKRKTIVTVIFGVLIISQYEGKKSKIAPQVQKKIGIVGDVKIMQLAKDSLLAVFFQDAVSFYILDGVNSRQTSKKQYKAQKDMLLFQVGQCVQNILNVFFSKQIVRQQIDFFELWCLPIDISNEKIVLHEFQKIYEVKQQFKSTLKIQNLTKDCFFMNLGQQIMMFRKGYCVDNVFINLKIENSELKYFNDKKLIHVSPEQIDFYDVTIDMISNPPKLSIKSIDSISQIDNKKFRFMDLIKFQEHKFGFFYQYPLSNASGQIKYFFILTQRWNFEEKIKYILPKVSEYRGNFEDQSFKKLLQKIQVSCDIIGKMGVSKKQAYLRIWKESNKQSVQEFKLLLDTHDYDTIKEQILLKLKKKSMLLLEVIKIQSGCLGMISQDLFSPKNYSPEVFKNYVISHYLMRKLQLFKQVKLYEKKMGKIKLTASQINEKSQNKLLINVQEYTNVTQMDIKAHLLELIYNFCKFKKDLSTEIRMVLKKFKFAFRFIYQSLLKSIIEFAKQDILYLLKNIPELLPYIHQEIQHEDPLLFSGIWGDLREQQWQKCLYLDTVATVFNKQMIQQFSNNVWSKRYWLTFHDVIYCSKAEIQASFNKIKGQNIFYGLIQSIFQNCSNSQKQIDLINYIQDKYVTFPRHLYNNIFLYRQLFNYFKKFNVMDQKFQSFLRKNDQQIFKKIFDHQKFKKGSFLKDLKPIFQSLNQHDKFNYGLLKYFSSNLSEISDIKYLLNRINNQKLQFHAQHEEMYEVLIKGMQIKLKLGSEKDIPISEILIYMTNIPLAEDNPVSKELKILQKIDEEGTKFKNVKINMSVFQIIRNRDNVLLNIIAYEIKRLALSQVINSSQIFENCRKIIDEIKFMREKIYGPFQDNIIMFLFLIKLLQNASLVPFVPQILVENTKPDLPFDNGQLENVVYFCYKKIVIQSGKYSQIQTYLQSIISLLPQDNNLRQFVSLEIELASIFSKGNQQILYPISGQSGLISKTQLTGLLTNLSYEGLLSLNLERVYEISSCMEKIINGKSLVSLYELKQTLFSCFLKLGALKQALQVIQSMIAIDQSNINNIIYPIIIFKRIANQFTDENKLLMANIILIFFRQPIKIVQIYKSLFSRSYSNQQQKSKLSQIKSAHSQIQTRFNSENILFEQSVIDYLRQNPDNKPLFYQLLQTEFNHLANSQQDFTKNIQVLIYYMIIIQEPTILPKYLQISKYNINFKEVRSFLSYLSKYQTFNTTKCLQYGKRLYKILYDHENESISITIGIKQYFSIGLEQTLIIQNLRTGTSNLEILVKSIERFKSKMKGKSLSNRIIKQINTQNADKIQSKFNRINQRMLDINKTSVGSQYPYNDSDSGAYKPQYLVMSKFKQGRNDNIFDQNKYLLWLFDRTNQQIEYYLLTANQSQAEDAIKKQQQALKLSFRKFPSPKPLIRNVAKVVEAKIQQKVQNSSKEVTQKFPLLPISTIPNIQESAISVGSIWTEEVEQVVLSATIIKTQILNTMIQGQDKVSFDPTVFQQFANTQLQSIIPDLIKEIYHDEQLDYNIILLLIQEINSLYPKIAQINQGFIEIYAKIDQIQKKLTLNLQMKSIMPVEGLRIKEKDCSILFNFVKSNILEHLNQNNVHTLPRIISLAFKQPSFQLELNNQFLNIIIQQYGKIEEDTIDQSMMLQKIIAFAEKFPISNLMIEIEKNLENLQKTKKKNTIIRKVCEILRKRNDIKSSQVLEAKLSPQIDILS